MADLPSKSKSSRSTSTNPDAPAAGAGGNAEGYTVVARRYRPRCFEDVVGQDHVVQALRNAVRMNRVTHAYLFSGTRGVGKTSIARIFAKCLNCEKGPTDKPCLQCDTCQAIAVGQDVDVIEIDGASNNGVEAVRELRQNVGLRPSRSRFKIYYIDEVHMLSTGAFNALLKTLEEPPGHVKFFFATTEPNKIPITVLSRCQRYDFAGISPDQIVATLSEICRGERVNAEEEALRAIARRASGSMRDAQSLLEQLLSFGGEVLTLELVHSILGIASDDRTLDLLDALSKGDAAEALKITDLATASGVQPSELLSGSLEFLRDVMVLSAGADVSMLAASPRRRPRIQEIASRRSLDSILAMIQILAEAKSRLRGSPHGRLLVELAFVKASRIENLNELAEILNRISAMESGPPASEKKKRVTVDVEVVPEIESAREPQALPLREAESEPSESLRQGPGWDLSAIRNAWQDWTAGLGADLGGKVSRLSPTSLVGPGMLVVEVGPSYNWVADACDSPEARGKIEAHLGQWLGRPVKIRIDRPSTPEPGGSRPKSTTSSQRVEGLEGDPLVAKVVELFEARLIRADLDDGSDAAN